MDRKLDMELEIEDANNQRPEPNGIKGWLLVLSVFLMIVVPLFSFPAMHEIAISGGKAPHRLLTAILIRVVCIGCFSWIAGYLIYSGNHHGRTAGILCFAFSGMGTGGTILVRIFMFGFASVGIAQYIRLGITVLIIRFFIASAICKNNYDRKYRSYPICPPLSLGQKIVLFSWGLFIAGYGAFSIISIV